MPEEVLNYDAAIYQSVLILSTFISATFFLKKRHEKMRKYTKNKRLNTYEAVEIESASEGHFMEMMRGQM